MASNKEIRPGMETEADKIQAGGLEHILQQTSDRLVGSSVEKPLDATLWRLVDGSLGLQDLTFALRGFYSVGFDDGRRSLADRLARAEGDRDTYFEKWQHPGRELTEVRLRRMREAAEEYWAELVAGGVR